MMLWCLIVQLLLGLTFCLISRADYPPNDLSYRVHYHDLYPKEVPESTLCQNRANGAYPHRNLDLGDPRCTFVVCSNSRPVVQSCPRGTRTTYNLDYRFLQRPHASRLGIHLYPPISSKIPEDDLEEDIPDEARKNQLDKPSEEAASYGYKINTYSPLYFHHKMCNVHDINGVCGNPFPDLNAYSNEIPRTNGGRPKT